MCHNHLVLSMELLQGADLFLKPEHPPKTASKAPMSSGLWTIRTSWCALYLKPRHESLVLFREADATTVTRSQEGKFPSTRLPEPMETACDEKSRKETRWAVNTETSRRGHGLLSASTTQNTFVSQR